MNCPRPKPLSNRPVYLIADLHLGVGTPTTVQLLLDFLNGPARRADALYILGDLFEVWIGDDAPPPSALQIAWAIKALTDSGVKVYFLCGNRDFLLGDSFCALAGMQRIHEPVHLHGHGPATALLHGDTLCTDDLDYQRFRARVRDPDWQRRTLSRPRWWRKILSRIARTISRQRNRSKPAEIMDVNSDAVSLTFRSLSIDRLIHGHTHRPAIHRLNVDGRPVTRVVLGDWHEDRGSAIRLEPEGQLELLQIVYDDDKTIRLQTIDSISPAPAS